MIKIEKAENCTIVDTMHVDKIETPQMIVQKQYVRNTEGQTQTQTQTEVLEVDEVMYENFVFVRKYGSYEKLKVLRAQIWKCLATEEKVEKDALVDPTVKNQWMLIYGLLVTYRMIEDRKGAEMNFLRQMQCFFPEIVDEPKRWLNSLSTELKLWRDANGVLLPFGQWSMNRNIYQEKKLRRFTAIAQRIKPFIAEAM